jgi:ribosomal silencing factor RsfS
MDRQEKHRQKKEIERAEKNKSEKAYEEGQQQRRWPVNSVGLVVVGILLVSAILYVWTVGLARPW